MDREITILCIDDDEQICFALKALFRLQGWNTVTAHSVDEGLAAFRAEAPDIVLIDYHMPRVNGVEGVQMLRRLNETVPILVFTIDESQAVADAFLAAGASDFALKPIKAPDIVSRIKLHLRLLGQNAAPKAPAAPARPRPAKGISQSTIELIMDYLAGQQDYVTANDIAAGTGLAYQTVYRYLQYTTQEKMTEMLNVYGKVGRPKQVYRKL
ncbi:MAG: response regulator [Oscillospiraceae bacterium]|nr:response regulator [Oscillospiraceae bacterium]